MNKWKDEQANLISKLNKVHSPSEVPLTASSPSLEQSMSAPIPAPVPSLHENVLSTENGLFDDDEEFSRPVVVKKGRRTHAKRVNVKMGNNV